MNPRKIRHRTAFVSLGAAVVMVACSRQPAPVEPVPVLVQVPLASSSASPAASSATMPDEEPVLDEVDAGTIFGDSGTLAGRCEVFFDQKDPCTSLRRLLTAHDHPQVRACAYQAIDLTFPEFRGHCSWSRFSFQDFGSRTGTDCYTDREVGYGVLCEIQNPDEINVPPFVHYRPIEETVRKCFQGWRFEHTNKSKRFHEEAFALERVSQSASGPAVTRVQVCRSTEQTDDIDHPTNYVVRLEFFTEHPFTEHPKEGDAGAR